MSEPAAQDVSDNMDILAALFIMSKTPYLAEARDLVWYGKTALQDPLLNRAYNERRLSSLEPSDPRYEVMVLRNEPRSQILQPFDRSKGHVVALVPSQALNCGIGPSRRSGVTHLSAKDVLRWSKLAEWLNKYEQRQLRDEVTISQSEELDSYDSMWKKLLYSPFEKMVLRHALSVHVPDLPLLVDSSIALHSELWLDVVAFLWESNVLVILLVALPLVYGGIHLTTWNFRFPSQAEHILWKIASIDIMGTIPLVLTFFGCIYVWSTYYEGASDVSPSVKYISWILLTPMSIFYALSRIYIVVESFISLRHVPIGVYAVVPWVQDIPHI